jgi:outer membrane protein OmpA-like peptidoglycan-associated protein
MSRSSRSRAARTAWVAAGSVALSVTGVLPGAGLTLNTADPDESGSAQVLDLTAEVVDISAEVESLDGLRADRSTPTTRTVILTSDVLFAFNSADLTPEAIASLEMVADELRADDLAGLVQIDGHTDDQGSDALNLDLSQRRATSVAAVLTPLLADLPVELTTQGFGETRPRVPNLDATGQPIPENQARNRRVEISTTT